jgi:hypothetical protein
MDLDSFYKIAGLISFIFGFINFIFVVVAKTFWNLTFKKLEQDVIILKESERKNSIVRHDFKNVTNSVYAKIDNLESTLSKVIDTGFIHVKELFEKEISSINKRIDEKK